MNFAKALLKLKTSTGDPKVDIEAKDRNSLTPLVRGRLVCVSGGGVIFPLPVFIKWFDTYHSSCQ